MEKNEIFNLTHLTLRLLLHIIQKGNDKNIQKLVPMFTATGMCLKNMMLDNDVPMDTKSVCGILYMSIYIIENGPNSWLHVSKEVEKKQIYLMRMDLVMIPIAVTVLLNTSISTISGREI